MTQTEPLTIAVNVSGLALGYAVLNMDRTVYAAFTTTGMVEVGSTGVYAVAGGVVVPDAGGYIQVYKAPGTEFVGEAAVRSTSANVTNLTEVAEAVLLADWEDVTGTVPDRSTLNALRFLRNKWSISGGTLTVTGEDDTTAAWTAAVTGTPDADPVTGFDPA